MHTAVVHERTRVYKSSPIQIIHVHAVHAANLEVLTLILVQVHLEVPYLSRYKCTSTSKGTDSGYTILYYCGRTSRCTDVPT